MSTGPLCEPFQKDETTTTIVYFCTRSKPDAYQEHQVDTQSVQ
jgi:hypothetical protein